VTIAVTTPTGHVGSHVARMLCQAGERPRLLLRSPDRLDPEVRERADLAVGDQRDADHVAEATRGVDALVAGKWVVGRFREASGPARGVVVAVMVWGFAFGGEFLVLEAVVLVLGDASAPAASSR
jgi:nucleoside-diphosphate-sugar epimerase